MRRAENFLRIAISIAQPVWCGRTNREKEIRSCLVRAHKEEVRGAPNFLLFFLKNRRCVGAGAPCRGAGAPTFFFQNFYTCAGTPGRSAGAH